MPLYEKLGLPNTSSGMQIKSIQRVSGSIANGSGFANVTILPVNPAKTVVIFNGSLSTSTFAVTGAFGQNLGAQLVDSTTVRFNAYTAASAGSFSGNLILSATVVEFT